MQRSPWVDGTLKALPHSMLRSDIQREREEERNHRRVLWGGSTEGCRNFTSFLRFSRPFFMQQNELFLP